MLDYLLNRTEKELVGVHPTVAAKARELVKKMYDEGIKIAIIQGFRSFAEQNDLYAVGRTKPGTKVTNAKGGQSIHNYGLAVDFCIFDDNKKPVWTVNKDWKRVCAVAEAMGFEIGLKWRFYDPPHLQMTFGLTLSQLQAAKRPPSAPKVEIKPVKNVITAPQESYEDRPIVPYPNKLIKKGSEGTDVMRIQRAIGLPEKQVDGIFGSVTEQRVKAYQKAHKLVADGIVGKKTWNMMF
ncbi:D-alanyl-D-alanine carboxypeptidase family protein [Priestia megaterium]|uniref:D-alanyl-D-alanine carboxypeptidase family protein n=1 Tax=Priestia megaterium TaxID=1404 RepID=UPI00203FC7B2|nr:D-alanyl-D-alanine carboxypeptidase family protein [Priestia megaterium]MCM3792515.1 D-alanyl-D-alanine carboxypeptidase family protein [Priestia megaterium]